MKRASTVAATSWTQHRLVFEGTPLADVVEQFNRYNERQLILEGNILDRYHISGVYASQDPASLLTFLRTEKQFKIVEEADRIRILHHP